MAYDDVRRDVEEVVVAEAYGAVVGDVPGDEVRAEVVAVVAVDNDAAPNLQFELNHYLNLQLLPLLLYHRLQIRMFRKL